MNEKEILFKQLEFISDLYIEDDMLYSIDDWIKNLIIEFNIPEKLINAFVCYAEEFLRQPEECVNSYGCFWNDDVNESIINKYNSFFYPILEYCFPKNDNMCVVQPSWDDSSIICCLTNDKCVYLVYKKSWNDWYESKNILNDLNKIAQKMQAQNK